MTAPAKTKWWDDIVSVDSIKMKDDVYLLWGDRVRVLDKDANNSRARVFARGAIGWIPEEALGGEPLLELYFIDVGQGDGVLVVTPEGHHLMIDGGHQRSRQQTGKSAADFVDWKFHKEYLFRDERTDSHKNVIRLDAMIASHADADHYGGLRDLVDRDIENKADELDSSGITVEAFYHPGLCPQEEGPEGLGQKSNGHFIQLLGNRDSAIEGLSDNSQNAPRIRGWWRDFISAVTELKRADGKSTPIIRLSQKSLFLPGFAETDESSATIRVLAPIEASVGGTPGLRDLGDEGVNKNGHSIALRIDYGDRKILLTGDLNDHSQSEIMVHYGAHFEATWGADVAKACHHGSHHVDYDFLKGIGAISTIFSSGDANTYDHPRAWVLGAAALSGRVIEDLRKKRLKAPLVYSTEIARSVALASIDQLRKYNEPQNYARETEEPVKTISGKVTVSKWRTVIDRDSEDARDMPPIPNTKVLRNIIYGLVNVRTDGKRLLFAVRNEGNHSWSYETIEREEIESAFRMKPENV